MQLNLYQKKAIESDAINWDVNNGSEIPLLGIIGEFGSVSGVFKKKQRDGEAYSSFKEDLIEELGDLLWYVVVTAHRLNIEIDFTPQNNTNSDIYQIIYKTTADINKLVTFDGIRDLLATGTNDRINDIQNLVEIIITDIHFMATHVGADIFDIAEKNSLKTPSFFKSDLDKPAHQFDSGLPEYEIFPRKFDIDFIDAGKGKSMMQMNGVNIGDKLTDNSYDDDGYRFHDVFHLTNVATLGWSPVFRRMIFRKRKSKPELDENEDGARAAIVEELVVNLIFSYAKKNSFLEYTNNVDIGLLKQILKLVEGIEVEKAEAWEWKYCIVQGCKIFREIRNSENGKVSINSDNRSIIFEKA